MSSSRKGKCKQVPKEMRSPTTQRPPSLLQRLSSSFSSMITSLPQRRLTPKHDIPQRPKTAPDPYRTITSGEVTDGPQLRHNRREVMPRIEIPTLSDPNSPCLYDPSSYHTFPSIEKSRCDLCGLRPPSRPTSGIASYSRPCSEYQSRSAFSHIAYGRKSSHREYKRDLAERSSQPRSREDSSPPEAAPRLVSASVAARRIGNPPRRASLPIARLFPPRNLDSLHYTHSIQAARQRSENVGTAVVRPNARDIGDIKGYPYVHKREVEQHLTALEAGSQSPLGREIGRYSPRSTPTVVADYSETVFYGTSFSSASNRRSNEPRSLSPSQLQSTMLLIQRTESTGRVIINNIRQDRPISLETESEGSGACRRCSPRPPSQAIYPRPPHHVPQPPESESTASSTDTLAIPIVGGRRLELKGGSHGGGSRLRGGDIEKCAPSSSRGLRLKTWILTASCPSYNNDIDSDCDIQPARTPNPARVAQASQRACGSVSLLAEFSRGSFAMARIDKTSHSATTSEKNSHRCPLTAGLSSFRCLPFPRKPAESPVNIPATTQPPSSITSKPLLRGGTGSSPSLLDTDRLPPTLYWLVGGTGRRPVTVAAWKKRKPKKRMNGLLGMVLYGGGAGKGYVKEGTNKEQGK